MILEEKAKEVGKNYLDTKGIQYSSIYPRIGFHEKDEILHGKRIGEMLDVYSFHFAQLWGLQERGLVLYIDAETGEPLYIMTPHGYMDIEE